MCWICIEDSDSDAEDLVLDSDLNSKDSESVLDLEGVDSTTVQYWYEQGY